MTGILLGVTKDAITQEKASQKLNKIKELLSEDEIRLDFSYYLQGYANNDDYIIKELSGLDIKLIAKQSMTSAQSNLQEETIHQMITEVVGNCMKEAGNKIKVSKPPPVKSRFVIQKPRSRTRRNIPNFTVLSKKPRISSSNNKARSLKKLNEDIESIRDEIIENQIMVMASEILVENLKTEQNRKIESQKEEVIIAGEPEPVEGMYKPGYMSDSFDNLDSDCDIPAIPNYNYSPEYKMYANDEPSPIKVIHVLEERKNDLDLDFDSDAIVNNESIHQNLNLYNMDTSKVAHKMEDVGYSPFKDIIQQEDPASQQ